MHTLPTPSRAGQTVVLGPDSSGKWDMNFVLVGKLVRAYEGTRAEPELLYHLDTETDPAPVSESETIKRQVSIVGPRGDW